jgi:hypothetical protein
LWYIGSFLYCHASKVLLRFAWACQKAVTRPERYLSLANLEAGKPAVPRSSACEKMSLRHHKVETEQTIFARAHGARERAARDRKQILRIEQPLFRTYRGCSELDLGGLATERGIQYTPGANRLEAIDMSGLAVFQSAPIYTRMCMALID